MQGLCSTQQMCGHEFKPLVSHICGETMAGWRDIRDGGT